MSAGEIITGMSPEPIPMVEVEGDGFYNPFSPSNRGLPAPDASSDQPDPSSEVLSTEAPPTEEPAFSPPLPEDAPDTSGSTFPLPDVESHSMRTASTRNGLQQTVLPVTIDRSLPKRPLADQSSGNQGDSQEGLLENPSIPPAPIADLPARKALASLRAREGKLEAFPPVDLSLEQQSPRGKSTTWQSPTGKAPAQVPGVVSTSTLEMMGQRPSRDAARYY